MASNRSFLRGATLGAALLALPAVALADFYCCQSAGSGRRVCGDTLPEACQGHAYKILSSSGNLLREVGAPLTPEQKAAAQALAQQKQEQDARRIEQRRRDAALLQTYANSDDIDRAQERAEREVQQSLAEIGKRLDALRAESAKLQAEAGNRDRATLPTELQRALRNNEQDLKTQEQLRNMKRDDLEKIRSRFGSERRRYNELTGQMTAVPTADNRPR